MSSQGTTSRGEVAATVAANACTHCIGVAWSGRKPIFAMKPLFSARALRGVSSETVKPALAKPRGMRAVPGHRVAVETSRTESDEDTAWRL